MTNNKRARGRPRLHHLIPGGSRRGGGQIITETWTWVQARKAERMAATEHTCEECHGAEAQRIVHVVPVWSPQARLYDPENFRVMCKPCASAHIKLGRQLYLDADHKTRAQRLTEQYTQMRKRIQALIDDGHDWNEVGEIMYLSPSYCRQIANGTRLDRLLGRLPARKYHRAGETRQLVYECRRLRERNLPIKQIGKLLRIHSSYVSMLCGKRGDEILAKPLRSENETT